MKILLLADIHANWVALSSIRESFDACLFVGDLVEYGTDPVPCIEWVRQHCHAAVRGNHDHSTAQRVPAANGGGCRQLAGATRQLQERLLDSAHYKFLARLPVTQTVTLGGHSFHLVHATPRDPMDEYLADDPAVWQNRLHGIEADFVCVGHTHLPLHLQLGKTQLVNPGSVGQPRDGDPRAAYAVIEDGRVSLRRVAYDLDAAVAQMRAAGLDPASADIAEAMWRSGGRSATITPCSATPTASSS